MRLLIQRSPDPVPYRAAYVRVAGAEGQPSRCALVLAPDAGAEILARALALVLALGDASGGAPIRQLWLGANGRVEGKLGSGIAPRHAEEVDRVATRIGREWERFVGNALARLRGEARGDAHFHFPGGEWDPGNPVVQVTRWPPLQEEALPALE